MASQNNEQTLSPEERLFQEYLTRGDDFCKIGIYRHAVSWYRKAVELRPDDPDAIKRLQECGSKIKDETRTILIIMAVAAIITILAVIVF